METRVSNFVDKVGAIRPLAEARVSAAGKIGSDDKDGFL
jgi:hypothetical protein